MTALTFTLVVLAISAVAGFLGALTGLGGGVVVVPALTLALGVDMKYAIGASLVSVIATSSGAAAAYVKEGFSNIRIGMFLEIATTLGASPARFLTVYRYPRHRHHLRTGAHSGRLSIGLQRASRWRASGRIRHARQAFADGRRLIP